MTFTISIRSGSLMQDDFPFLFFAGSRRWIGIRYKRPFFQFVLWLLQVLFFSPEVFEDRIYTDRIQVSIEVACFRKCLYI